MLICFYYKKMNKQRLVRVKIRRKKKKKEAVSADQEEAKKPIDRIAVQLTYYQTTEKQITRTRRTFQFSELAVF